jgi:hypothetical protein
MDYQAAILENQLRAITPELMAGSTPNFNHRYIYLLAIFYRLFTRGEHYGPGHFIYSVIMLRKINQMLTIFIGTASYQHYHAEKVDISGRPKESHTNLTPYISKNTFCNF